MKWFFCEGEKGESLILVFIPLKRGRGAKARRALPVSHGQWERPCRDAYFREQATAGAEPAKAGIEVISAVLVSALPAFLLPLKIDRVMLSRREVNQLPYELPSQLEKAIADFVDYHNHRRYHKVLGNVTPADVMYGRREQILQCRKKVQIRTVNRRRDYNQGLKELVNAA